ncbi:diacylglycerol/lipid kinase family protein [Arthrobacter sp. B2a2-09]|uniref:diacylglycerol/lipid kinase family protein n=1 Tax=Arthrobacter sp. B2a2-09 TaxID=2952822 RepID=UPI0022CDB636|nr:diacylglycerol kinase family protein [Arthrobacter sp. B2a2-09]MCZ9882811.1 NAD(+)/NADH kinase [Arthrobacter sp. B2a2-09]
MTDLLHASVPRQGLLAAEPPQSLLVSQAAIVVNTSKFSTPRAMERFQTEVESTFVSHGWTAPFWLQTTAESRGAKEARWAVRAGVDVVLVAGGDGTIRTVAQELAGSDIPIALLPIGTGNLLARNLGIPRKNITAAVQIACNSKDHPMDVGRLELDRTGNGNEVQGFVFLVMAGAGFDAATVGGADDTMKSGLGPAAYLLSGARATQEKMAFTTICVDGSTRRRRESHGVIVGNCGSLTMGLRLMPGAIPDDGLLDGVALLQRNVTDWARAAWSVVTRSRGRHRSMPRFQGRVIEVLTDAPQPVQVDGDVVGAGRMVRFHVQAEGLLVRRPDGRTAQHH